jgi:hypothetical protein
MGAFGIFFACYFGAIFLKIIGFPGFKDIKWGWFIVAPILFPIVRLLWVVLSFCFYVAFGFAAMYGIVELVLWASTLK